MQSSRKFVPLGRKRPLAVINSRAPLREGPTAGRMALLAAARATSGRGSDLGSGICIRGPTCCWFCLIWFARRQPRQRRRRRANMTGKLGAPRGFPSRSTSNKWPAKYLQDSAGRIGSRWRPRPRAEMRLKITSNRSIIVLWPPLLMLWLFFWSQFQQLQQLPPATATTSPRASLWNQLESGAARIEISPLLRILWLRFGSRSPSWSDSIPTDEFGRYELRP